MPPIPGGATSSPIVVTINVLNVNESPKIGDEDQADDENLTSSKVQGTPPSNASNNDARVYSIPQLTTRTAHSCSDRTKVVSVRDQIWSTSQYVKR